MGKIVVVNGTRIVVRTRDHCDPHVHAIHKGEGWEFRIYFSYANTLVQAELPALKGNPKTSRIQECMNAVTDELDKCRREFWTAMQCVCLENQYVKLVNGVILDAVSNESGALKVSAAKYHPNTKSVSFTAGTIGYTGKCP